MIAKLVVVQRKRNITPENEPAAAAGSRRDSHARKVKYTKKEQISHRERAGADCRASVSYKARGHVTENEPCAELVVVQSKRTSHEKYRTEKEPAVAELVVAQRKRNIPPENEPNAGSRRERAMRESCIHEERANTFICDTLHSTTPTPSRTHSQLLPFLPLPPSCR